MLALIGQEWHTSYDKGTLLYSIYLTITMYNIRYEEVGNEKGGGGERERDAILAVENVKDRIKKRK